MVALSRQCCCLPTSAFNYFYEYFCNNKKTSWVHEEVGGSCVCVFSNTNIPIETLYLFLGMNIKWYLAWYSCYGCFHQGKKQNIFAKMVFLPTYKGEKEYLTFTSSIYFKLFFIFIVRKNLIIVDVKEPYLFFKELCL